MLRCFDEQPALPWEDRAKEARTAEARRERSKRRRRERLAAAA